MTYNSELRRQVRKLDDMITKLTKMNQLLLKDNTKMRVMNIELKKKYAKVTDVV